MTIEEVLRETDLLIKSTEQDGNMIENDYYRSVKNLIYNNNVQLENLFMRLKGGK